MLMLQMGSFLLKQFSVEIGTSRCVSERSSDTCILSHSGVFEGPARICTGILVGEGMSPADGEESLCLEKS